MIKKKHELNELLKLFAAYSNVIVYGPRMHRDFSIYTYYVKIIVNSRSEQQLNVKKLCFNFSHAE